MYKAFVFYCSPAGTTRQVAKAIEKKLVSYGRQVIVCELGKEDEKLSEAIRELEGTKDRVSVFIGSPVYASHALPLVMEFIERLPLHPQAYAIPFVTWGGATSGLALAEMGDALTGREYVLAGAARVMAVHSLMWELPSPVGLGHPDSADERMIENLIAVVERNLQRPEPLQLSSQVLSYQSEAVAVEMRKLSLKIARGLLPPRVVDEDLCTECGVCVDQCPVAALTLEPYPVYAEHCILCFNCMRCCPEKAIAADLSAIHERVRERADNYREEPLSDVFIPAGSDVNPV